MIISFSMLSHTYQRHSSLFYILIKYIKTILLAIYYCCCYYYNAYQMKMIERIQHRWKGIRVSIKRTMTFCIIFMHVPALGNTHTHSRMPTYSFGCELGDTDFLNAKPDFWLQTPFSSFLSLNPPHAPHTQPST